MSGIGALRERIEIQQVATSRDAIGGEVQTWGPLAGVWARVEPMSSSEQWRRQQMQASAAWKITIRWRADVTTKHRVVWGTRVFLVKGVTNSDERKRFLVLACDEMAAP